MAAREFINDLITSSIMSRRSFLKWSAIFGGTAAVASI
ncbi:twin-arginine translocation signal domain-containing protein [Candidatus Flexifilum breve]